MDTTATDLDALEAALLYLQNACLSLDLAQARFNQRLVCCRQLAGDAMALLEEADG